MTDILDDLKAPNLFCGSLRKRAAEEIEILTKRATVLQRRVEELRWLLTERDESIDARDKKIKELLDRFGAIQKALDGE